MIFVKHYDVTVKNDNGADVTASLRLTLGAQINLKKKYGEDTRSTLFSAASDDEKLIDIVTEALNWNGNTNEIKSGEELIERMIDSGDFGIIARQNLVVEIGAASGIFSDKEKTAMLKRVDNMETAILDGDGVDDDTNGAEKNA